MVQENGYYFWVLGGTLLKKMQPRDWENKFSYVFQMTQHDINFVAEFLRDSFAQFTPVSALHVQFYTFVCCSSIIFSPDMSLDIKKTQKTNACPNV